MPGRITEKHDALHATLLSRIEGGAEREAYVQELKNALFRYLDPLVGTRLGRGDTTRTAT